jgi:hypothetical protein
MFYEIKQVIEPARNISILPGTPFFGHFLGDFVIFLTKKMMVKSEFGARTYFQSYS